MSFNELVSYSNMEIYTLHKSLETHLVKSKHNLFDYIYEDKFHLKFLYSYNYYTFYAYILYMYYTSNIYIHIVYIDSMKQITQIKQIPQEVQDKIMGEMVFFKDGIYQIALGNYALDFKQSYAFLGFTKNKTQVILGQINTWGELQQDGTRKIKYNKKYGRVEYEVRSKTNYVKGTDGKYISLPLTQYGEWRIITDGYRYSETIMEVPIQ